VKKKQDSTDSSLSSVIDIAIKNNIELTPIDVISIDKYSRLTLTKKLKKIFSLNPEDKIIVYQEKYNKNIILKVQRDEMKISNWILTRSKDDLNDNMDVHFKKGFYKNNDIIDNFNNNEFTIKEMDSKIKNNGETEGCQYKYNIGHKENTLYNVPILLVDDEPDLLTTFDFFLRNEGYKNVKTFSNSKNVLKHISDLKNSLYYKLAILDIRMPDINGIQIYQILKILNPSIKIIFLTALDAASELTSLYSEVKFEDIIRKPIDNDRFIEKVNDKVNRLELKFT
jgi:CheY-like chemotaxis protein